MPEGRVGGWRWMLRRSDARRTTLRELGAGVGRNASGGVLSWDAHVDVWCVGFRFEATRESLEAR